MTDNFDIFGVRQNFADKLKLSLKTYTFKEQNLAENINVYFDNDNPKHLLLVDDDLKIIRTQYDLTQEEHELVEKQADDEYYSQSWIDPNDYTHSYTFMVEKAQENLYGVIEYPDILTINYSEAKKYINDKMLLELNRLAESHERTINMYKDDNRKSLDSYNKIEKFPAVEKLEVGTTLYKFVNQSYGVFRYRVEEIKHDENYNIDMYRVTCLNCQHGDGDCELWLFKTGKDSYAYFTNVTSNVTHLHFHSSHLTSFHSSNKTAYDDYIKSIHDYNDKVIANYTQLLNIINSILENLKNG